MSIDILQFVSCAIMPHARQKARSRPILVPHLLLELLLLLQLVALVPPCPACTILVDPDHKMLLWRKLLQCQRTLLLLRQVSKQLLLPLPLVPPLPSLVELYLLLQLAGSKLCGFALLLLLNEFEMLNIPMSAGRDNPGIVISSSQWWSTPRLAISGRQRPAHSRHTSAALIGYQ